jgi:hypothetical protein
MDKEEVTCIQKDVQINLSQNATTFNQKVSYQRKTLNSCLPFGEREGFLCVYEA